MVFSKENFPKILDKEIKKRGISRIKFCKKIGISRSTLDNWLYLKTPPGMIGVLNFFLNKK